jgi:hypothetical protein
MQRATLLTAFLFITAFSFSQEHLSGKNVLLPVRLLSFKAKLKKSNNVILNWVTSPEKTMSHFVVQRSADGNNFDDKAIVFTEQNNNTTKRKYDYSDNTSATESSVLYYRLKMVGLNGGINYSQIKKIRLKK